MESGALAGRSDLFTPSQPYRKARGKAPGRAVAEIRPDSSILQRA
jgi:hypothetical protein